MSNFATLPVTDASIAGAEVAAVPARTYTGKAEKPRPKVIYQGKTLKEGVDYELAYRNNVKAGKATIVITGKGAFVGTRTATFKIKKASIKKIKVRKARSKKRLGKAWRPALKAVFKGKTLKRGSDYKLVYKVNKKSDVTKAVFKGRGNFKGKKAVVIQLK